MPHRGHWHGSGRGIEGVLEWARTEQAEEWDAVKKSDIMKLKRVKKGDQTSGTLRRRNVCFLNTLVGLLTHFNLKDDRDFEF